MLYTVYFSPRDPYHNKKLKTNLQNVEIGDTFCFGNYQICNSTKPNIVHVEAPIIWQVLDKQGSKLLLFSKYALDWNFFDGSGYILGPTPDMDWSGSTIRQDLNSELFNIWFDDYEKHLILTTSIITECNPVFNDDKKPSVKTEDKLFLLSFDEVIKYFFNDKKSDLKSFIYEENGEYWYLLNDSVCDTILLFADPIGNHDDNKIEITFNEKQWWWLRTDGDDAYKKMVMEANGQININGLTNGSEEVGIRPAMWIDIDLIDSFI